MVGAREDAGCPQHLGGDRQLLQIVTGLGIEDRGRADLQPGRLKRPSPDRHIRPALGLASGLDVHQGLIPEGGDRHREGAGGHLVGDARRIDRDRGQAHGDALRPGKGGYEEGGCEGGDLHETRLPSRQGVKNKAFVKQMHVLH